jgi:ketosteroid isomerase-like protein
MEIAAHSSSGVSDIEEIMRKLVLLLIVLSGAAAVNAQQMTGQIADSVKNEIIKLEEEKAAIILKGGPEAAVYYDQFYDDDETYLSSYLSAAQGSRAKADIVADWRVGVPRILSTKHYDFQVRVYDKGNTAVVSYRATGVMQLKDKGPRDYDEKAMEVFVKQNEKWRVVAHSVVALQKP